MATGFDTTLRRSSAGKAIGVIGVPSIARQASEFMRSGLDSTPIFFSDSPDELAEARQMYSDQLAKAGVSSVGVEIDGGAPYMRRRATW